VRIDATYQTLDQTGTSAMMGLSSHRNLLPEVWRRIAASQATCQLSIRFSRNTDSDAPLQQAAQKAHLDVVREAVGGTCL
jgi:hypothetical protein